jgi:hypothetical protein
MLRANSIRSFSSAARSLVITASGRDRLGVVNDLAKALEASHGNIEESRMTVLGDDFSMVTASEKAPRPSLVPCTSPPADRARNIPRRRQELEYRVDVEGRLPGLHHSHAVRSLTERLFAFGS